MHVFKLVIAMNFDVIFCAESGVFFIETVIIDLISTIYVKPLLLIGLKILCGNAHI